MENILLEDLVITIVESSTMQQHNFANHFNSLKINNINYCKLGHETLVHLEKTKPDLIISCMYLSDMAGIELVNSIGITP